MDIASATSLHNTDAQNWLSVVSYYLLPSLPVLPLEHLYSMRPAQIGTRFSSGHQTSDDDLGLQHGLSSHRDLPTPGQQAGSQAAKISSRPHIRS